MIAHRRARSTTAAVREQRHVSARFKILNSAMSIEQTELDKMIPAAARAELRPCLVLVLFGNRADRPIRIQNVVCAAILEIRADADPRLCFDGAREAILLLLQVA